MARVKSWPSPAAAHDMPDFVHTLRLLKVWAGDPSFDRLARRSGIPRSTLADAVSTSRQQMPHIDVVRAFVSACGVESDGVEEWLDAWRRVQSSRTTTRLADVTPRELPVDIANFCGRATTLDELDAWNRRAARPRIVAICGTAGVGKTALGVH
jgi:hypothetical protein